MRPPDLRATQDRLTVMTDKLESAARDYSEPCSCRRPISPCAPACRRSEPELLKRWSEMDSTSACARPQKGRAALRAA